MKFFIVLLFCAVPSLVLCYDLLRKAYGSDFIDTFAAPLVKRNYYRVKFTLFNFKYLVFVFTIFETK